MSDSLANLTRRQFVLTAAAAVVIRPRSLVLPSDVEIVEFSASGQRLRTVRVPKVVKSDAEWRKQLTPFAVRDHAAEGNRASRSTGAYWDLHDKGLFRCICCDTALFSSAAKFDSGTGWPSFWQPIAEENVQHGKPSGGYVDSEVTCRRCDAHLGDLFDDGPKPTGLRYCIDSASLRFVKLS